MKMISLRNLRVPVYLWGGGFQLHFHHRDSEVSPSSTDRGPFQLACVSLLILVVAGFAVAQNQTKRNDRPASDTAPQQRREENKPVDPTRYTYEFSQPKFLVSHVVIEHDALGRGQITFERLGEETPIVEPVELSVAALGRILGLWTQLNFLDSTQNYQASKQFPHLGTYRVGMDDGKRKRTAEFNWSDNKQAWALITEYRRLGDQAILIFDMKLAREMQPLNTPQLMNQLDILLSRGELSDPHQLVPLLTELRTDEHIPLIARNHADRLLKKIEKLPSL
ncbi:MAG TPA: hypothetical protein VGU64_21160 [Terriglobales bacterium]|nr:hypothetical protein [Terriglobales bacterium]